MKPAALASIALLLLSGCSNAPTSLAEDDFDLDLVATDDTGVLRGVVVDAAIRPILDARVSLTPGGAQTRTTDTGAFGFQDLEPGAYTVTVNATGFIERLTQVTVVAGVDRPDVVKVQLEADPESTPYAQALVFTGFIECSTTLIALCAAPNIASEELGEDNFTNDRFIQYFEIDAPDPVLVQSELVWESTQAASDRLWFWHSHASHDGLFNGSFEFRQGSSPILLQTDADEIAAEAQDDGLDPHWQLVLRVFSGDIDGTTPPMCDPVLGFCAGPGFAIQQEFTAYTHLFYHAPPPSDWRFTTHGDPVASS